MKKNLLRLAFLTLPVLGFSQTYFSDNFDDEDVSDWTLYDQDGDGIQWADLFVIQDQDNNPVTPVSLISRSWQASVPLTPDNWIVSPGIDLTAATGQVFLHWKVKAAAAEWDNEHYSVYVGTQSDLTSLEASPVKFSETYDDPADAGTQYSRSLDLSSFVGQTVYIAFRHHDVTDMDYISIDDVVVKAPATVAPVCTTIIAPANGATGVAANATLSWAAAADADSYDIYMDTNADPTTLVGNVSGTSYSVASNLSLNTVYYWKIVPKNNVGTATGCTVSSFTTSATPPYCGPLEFIGIFGTENIEPITLVNFAGINNQTDAELDNSPGHEFFLDQMANVDASMSYNITLKGNTGGNYTNNFAVFIDWNQNGTFESAETYLPPAIVNSTGTDAIQSTMSIAVPADAMEGMTRMRVKKIFGTSNLSDACMGASYGQAEDYTVNVAMLAVSESAKSMIRTYPNPVKDIFNIEADGKIKSVKVYDVAGKQIFTKEMNEAKSQIDFSRFGAGVYVVTTQLENGSTTSTKVIKK